MLASILLQAAVGAPNLTELEKWLLGGMGTALVGVGAFVRFVVVAFMERHMRAFEKACAAIEQVPGAILALKTELLASLGERIERGTATVIAEVKDQRLVEIRQKLSTRPEPIPESSPLRFADQKG